MTDHAATTSATWTCPFCSLLCEGDAPEVGGACSRAGAMRAAHAQAAFASGPLVDGIPATLDMALADAATRLSSWRQPLFGGLGTDIAGSRALYRLAARTGAICDHADGATLMHGVRAMQDRGQYIATIGEVRSRADLIVFVGTDGVARYPELLARLGLGEAGSPCRLAVFIGAEVPAAWPSNVPQRRIAGSGDVFSDVQQLAALVAKQRVRDADPALTALAAELHAATYAVLAWEGAALPDEGALIVEALNRTVGTLNKKTRAATFGLGGSDGAFSANQTFAWLSGLPLRTRVSAQALVHEPQLFDAQRLMDDHAVDGLFWLSTFDPGRVPPTTAMPRIVLGPPAMSNALRDASMLHGCIFIPVATPGLNAAGHLFRTDGPVVLPVFAVRDDALPNAAAVITRLAELVEARA